MAELVGEALGVLGGDVVIVGDEVLQGLYKLGTIADGTLDLVLKVSQPVEELGLVVSAVMEGSVGRHDHNLKSEKGDRRAKADRSILNYQLYPIK